MKLALEDLVRNAFSGMNDGPRDLFSAVRFYAQQEKIKVNQIERELIKRIPTSPNDGIRKLFNSQLKHWDWEGGAPWIGGTEANTRERRDRIYELLQLRGRLSEILEEHVPFYEGIGNTLIDNPETPRDWYTYELRKRQDFYWRHFRAFLKKSRAIKDDPLSALDSATTSIVERLADPAANRARGSRGLVVGYVQSGKTTNFTGVIARAIDAGYRLIIIFSGTTNLLRNQTQRRMDMDLVGRENILRGAAEEEVQHDYKGDEDWPSKFISYGKQPSLLGEVDITRLTGQQDFESQDAGLNPLEFQFEKKNKQRPLFDRENLEHTGARLIVVKKQRDRLMALLSDLKSIGKASCAEIPALIIDDESDQASVNTVNPEKITDKTRSTINALIVEILERLPRSQYLGYTATPFANVFVDPKYPKDIYPRDFVLSLDRPEGYMGVREFHDFGDTPDGRLKNREAYIREIPLVVGKKTDDRLQEAIDAFVLTGALKKYREQRGRDRYRHHTMLVHVSPRKAHHRDVVKEIREFWSRSAYSSPGTSMARLEVLFADFRKIWLDRGKTSGLEFPKNFSELKPALGAALSEMRRGNPVLMVNSAEGAEVPNFDAKEGVWKIIVGGAKLSRGYTIEGLTISYFRRSTRVQDTLMQMGRWFGFRDGYQDLVRLYIGTAEPAGKDKTIDLYSAFEAMCRDEEDFRAQLKMYSKDSGITPENIPALVFNSHPQLRPTARNRMFNADVTWAAFDYREPTTQSVSSVGRKGNAKLFEKLFSKRKVKAAMAKAHTEKGAGFEFKWCAVSHDDVVKTLEMFTWEKSGSGIGAEIKYLREKECPVHSWVVVMPQVGKESKAGTWKFAANEFRCVSRTRLESRFGVFSDPAHVNFAKWLVGGTEILFQSPLKADEHTGVLLLYPTKERGMEHLPSKAIPVMGFAMVLPGGQSKGRRIAFRVRNK